VRKSFALLVVPVLAVLATACGSSKKSTTTTSAPAATTSTPAATTSTPAAAAPAGAGTKISSATVASLGPVLVNAQGKTLYIFEPDNAKSVTCTASCAAVWPPAMLSGSKAAAAGAVKASLLGADSDPSGGKVITYAGWPLYTFVGDQGSGSANGQAKDLNGGLWYVISPAGKVIKKAS
jgi:predicted lipoprotein with Yx(FWY)xxD motif